MEYHFWAELGRLGYNASFHSRLHILGGHLGHMIHVPITLAHYTVQQKWTIMAMLLNMVSVIPIVVYTVRNQILLNRKYFDLFVFCISITTETEFLPKNNLLSYKKCDYNDHNHNWQDWPNLHYNWTNHQWRKHANSQAIFEQWRKDSLLQEAFLYV